jgi:hypothetical protein
MRERPMSEMVQELTHTQAVLRHAKILRKTISEVLYEPILFVYIPEGKFLTDKPICESLIKTDLVDICTSLDLGRVSLDLTETISREKFANGSSLFSDLAEVPFKLRR